MVALRVLVVGGANVDLKVTASAPTAAGISTPGHVRVVAGGVARNVAEALARLGAAVRLLTVVGTDPWGEWLTAQTAQAGVDVRSVLRRPGQTGLYVMVDGHGVADVAIAESTPAQTWLDAAGEAGDLLVLDANPDAGTFPALARRAPRLALVGTSPAKVVRFRSILRDAWLIALTHAEAHALVGAPPGMEGSEALARAVAALGPRYVLLTAGSRGLGLLGEDWTAVPAHPGPAVNPTGAGDVAAAVVMVGLLRGWSAGRVLPLAARAAGLALKTWGNVPPDLGTLW